MERKQLELDFNRGRKLWILHKVSPLMPHSRMARVLRAIDDVSRNDAVVMLTHRQIAAYDGMSVPTARRGIQDLIDYQLLVRSETVSRSGQQANSYQIIWSNLDAIANGEALIDPAPVPEESTCEESETPAPVSEYESSQVVKVGGDHSDTPPDHHDQGADHSDQGGGDHHDQALLYPPININNPPPSNERSWLVVEENLRSLKVARSAEAVAMAERRGNSADQILQLLGFVRSKPGAYGPGAIFKRVCEAYPGENPAEGWPPPDPNYVRRQQQATAQDKRQQAAREASERDAKRQAAIRDRELLEQEFGTVLDDMCEDETRDLAKSCGPVVFRMLIRDPEKIKSGELRLMLLTKLKARQPDGLDNWNSAIADGPAIADRK